MEKNTLDFITLFRCAIHDSAPDVEADLDIEAMKTLADRHNAWPLVFMVLKEVYKDNAADKNWADYRNKFFFHCVKNMQHMYGLRKILSAFDQASIPYAILKGESLAELYPHPECRISSDIDLFVYPEDEARAIDVLLQNGITVEPRIPHAHHSECHSNACGKIELHVQWQNDLQNEILYKNKLAPSEPFIKLQTEALGSFTTIGINDGLYCHFAHLMTHFIAGGFGIRLISDLLLYIRKYKDHINAESFCKFLDDLGYHTFMDTLFGIGVKYLGFSKSDFFPFESNEDAVYMLMEDCINGGAFGHAEPGRMDTHIAYLKKRMENAGENYNAYIAKYKKTSDMSKLSFSTKNMEHLYHYVRKNRLLLPVAYVHHICFIGKRAFARFFKKKTAKPEQLHTNAQKRQTLLEKLDLQ